MILIGSYSGIKPCKSPPAASISTGSVIKLKSVVSAKRIYLPAIKQETSNHKYTASNIHYPFGCKLTTEQGWFNQACISLACWTRARIHVLLLLLIYYVHYDLLLRFIVYQQDIMVSQLTINTSNCYSGNTMSRSIFQLLRGLHSIIKRYFRILTNFDFSVMLTIQLRIMIL